MIGPKLLILRFTSKIFYNLTEIFHVHVTLRYINPGKPLVQGYQFVSFPEIYYMTIIILLAYMINTMNFNFMLGL